MRFNWIIKYLNWGTAIIDAPIRASHHLERKSFFSYTLIKYAVVLLASYSFVKSVFVCSWMNNILLRLMRGIRAFWPSEYLSFDLCYIVFFKN
jgi:hypothetical protein